VNVYIAAPINQSKRAAAFAEKVRDYGLNVVSSWHDEVPEGAQDPTHPHVRESIAKTLVFDLAHMHIMVALMDQGVGRGSFVEIGFALARYATVIWLQGLNGEGSCIFDADPNTVIVLSEEAALSQLIEEVRECG